MRLGHFCLEVTRLFFSSISVNRKVVLHSFQECEQLTGQKLICRTLVNTEGKKILDGLIKDLAPDAICKDIGLCP